MRTPFTLLAFLVTVSAAFSVGTAVANEPSSANPFLGFVGKYKVTFTECSVNGSPAGGCNLTGVELGIQRNGTLQITEETPDGPEVYQIYEVSDPESGSSEKASVTGSPDRASWEYVRTFSDGSQTATTKIFMRSGHDTFYHSYHRDRGTDGVDFVMKQTYTIEKSDGR